MPLLWRNVHHATSLPYLPATGYQYAEIAPKGECKIADLIAVLTSPEYGFKEVDFVDFSIKAKVLENVA
mgnify:CR=1 FL=1